MRIDPYKNEEKYLKWKKSGASIEGIQKADRDIIIRFLDDMEHGINIDVSNKKGARSYIRLNAYRAKLKLFAQLFQQRCKKKLTTVTREDFHKICHELRNGIIKRQDGMMYTDPADYIKSFKAFWHWWQRVNKKKIEDITNQTDVTKNKPKWVYLDEKQFKKTVDACTYDYRVIAIFEKATGLRPGELQNIRVSYFSDDFETLNVPDEISKTFGRNMKTVFAKDVIKQFVEQNNFKGDDLIFTKNTVVMNRYFKRLGKRLFGDEKSKGGKPYSQLTLHDFRHISACYWLPRYPTQQGMMYRFGWKNADKIFYYSEFLGMVDNIKEEDLLVDVSKSELQKEIEKLQHHNLTLKEDMASMVKFNTDRYKEILELKDSIELTQKNFNDKVSKIEDASNVVKSLIELEKAGMTEEELEENNKYQARWIEIENKYPPHIVEKLRDQEHALYMGKARARMKVKGPK